MKYLIVLVVVLVAFWVWRNNRREEREDRQRTGSTSNQPPKLEDMVSCPVCSVHLPAAEAVPGRRGTLYCSAGHRQQAEG